MIQNVLSGIGGVGIYGVISICIFVAVFLGVVIWLLRLKPTYLKSMRDLPLADDAAEEIQTDSNLKSKVSHE